MKRVKHILIFSILLIGISASAQVTFEAKVSKKTLGINERLRIDFKMNKDGDNFTPPSFSDFNIVGGPSQSISNSWVNNKRSYSKTYSYYLAPKKKGKFTIKQASVEIEGEIYKTLPVTVTVKSAVDKPNDGGSPTYEATENVHLVAEVSNSKPYLNQAITVVYKLYVSPNTGVSNWRETDTPRYNDFWSQNIDVKGAKVQNGKFKGEDYRYLVLRKTVLYPQKTGKLFIEPLVLDITVDVPTNRRDIFGGRLMSSVHVPVSAGRRTINVKPLPEENKPEDFTGAVGKFNFKVTTSKRQLDATESLQLKAEVSGKGNLKLFKLPKINLPSSLEVYEPEHEESVRTDLGGMRGKISDEYTVVPQYQGKYPIPSISFSYFDLETETYKRATSDEIIIDVLDGPVNAASDNNLVTGTGKQRVILSNEQFAFIKTTPDLTAIETPNFFKSNLFWASLLSPLLLIPLAIVFRRKREERLQDVAGNRIRKADKLARKYLGEAKRALGKKEAFYEALERALHNYLKGKLNIETSDFSKEKIQTLLKKRQVNDITVSEFMSLLKSAEFARYTPFSSVEMQQDYDKAAKTISEIDKQIR